VLLIDDCESEARAKRALSYASPSSNATTPFTSCRAPPLAAMRASRQSGANEAVSIRLA
jgi:hypothetical protein